MKLSKDLNIANSTTAPVIQVDDDDLTIDLVRIYYESSNMANPLLGFLSGEELLDYMSKVKQDGLEMPLLVLLDINMPGMDGFEVLKKLRTDTFYKKVPLCTMLSSSKYEKDINQSIDLGADSYLIKPDDAESYQVFFNDLAQRIKE